MICSEDVAPYVVSPLVVCVWERFDWEEVKRLSSSFVLDFNVACRVDVDLAAASAWSALGSSPPRPDCSVVDLAHRLTTTVRCHVDTTRRLQSGRQRHDMVLMSGIK